MEDSDISVDDIEFDGLGEDDQDLDQQEAAEVVQPDLGESGPTEAAEVSELLGIDPDDVNSDGRDDAAVADEAIEQTRPDDQDGVDADRDGTADGDELVQNFLDGVTRNARGESSNLLPALD